MPILQSSTLARTKAKSALFLAVVLLPVILFAQSGAGTIQGTVQDASGASTLR